MMRKPESEAFGPPDKEIRKKHSEELTTEIARLKKQLTEKEELLRALSSEE